MPGPGLGTSSTQISLDADGLMRPYDPCDMDETAERLGHLLPTMQRPGSLPRHCGRAPTLADREGLPVPGRNKWAICPFSAPFLLAS